MLIRLEKRPAPSRVMSYITPVIAVVLTVAVGAILFWALGYDAGEALYHFFITPFQSTYNIAEIGVKATPLILIGIGLAIGFRANVWNIGAEGQLIFGGVAAGAVALAFYDVESGLILPAMFIAGALGGMVYAAIPALLKTQFNVNEILSSLMLTYVAVQFLAIMVHGPLKDPDGFGFPQSRQFHGDARLPIILEGTRLHIGAIIALVVAGLGWLALSRSLFGFQVRVIGAAPAAARFADFSQKKMIWASLLIGGGLAGVAGCIEVSGPIGQLTDSISTNYGFTAIIVAFLGRLHPVGIVLGGLLVALSYIGGEFAQLAVGVPLAVTGVFQGLLLFFLLGTDVLIRYRVTWARHTKHHVAAPPDNPSAAPTAAIAGDG